ncbi:hypothetical protein PHMEG_00010744 [Phytophthora megakarya]|uniref:Uncharacterized protein n=1 Tax=Phytophthora megakarya TaxID=4795 RepID=A0A225WEZ0_9STRA|nr:hypothetical protein PHMEG_00010744 [Phytophthora megakarya]
MTALRRKMETFETQMATIRAQLAARRELTSSDPNVCLPVVNSRPIATSVTAEPSTSIERLKFPLLRRILRTKEANTPPLDPFHVVENILHRTVTREIYVREAETVATKELAAASVSKEAQQLGEEARKRMVAYTQNESGWRFEERTSRYQQVMEMKQQAETTQQEADLQREAVREMKSRLRDPYGELRSVPIPKTTIPSSPLIVQRKEHEWIWILASLSTKLAFTPRDTTADAPIANEKELSMYVVYYIAASNVNNKRVATPEQWEETLKSDCPPTRGWMCCSVHGVPPIPEVTSTKSGIQTWTVAGAGAGHLNGKYVACGVHDGVFMFKSSAGVELFRKRVPVTSSFCLYLRGGQMSRLESASSVVDNEVDTKESDSKPQEKKTKPSVVLPSGLVTVETDELDFRSMQRVGSWLTMNESNERKRRMVASLSDSDERTQSPGKNREIDGSRVMSQDSRETGTTDVTESRSEVSMSLCREWVLFARCSRRRTEKRPDRASEPPVAGIGLGCLKRHYYISFEEKRQMAVWVQTKESRLEKNILTVIIEREARIERVHHLSRQCMVQFQQNLRHETEKSKMKLLAELNRVRLLTVKVFETIDRWRQHAKKIGFTRYDNTATQIKNNKEVVSEDNATNESSSEPQTLLGWSVSITLDTGKQLYKGSKAFASKVRRFRRSEDINGKREHHIVYLGYYKTQDEAECAYDEHAVSEARRLNTTIEHLPRRRSVFRSCGKHFAVESERDGPSFCIECKTKKLALSTGTDEWMPPFFYGTGVNYIMKMENDLDFLDDILPLKATLNHGRGVDSETFPMRGNVFLLPKTPIQDPDLAVFTTFPTPTAPRVGESIDSASKHEIDDEALDRDRILRAQQIYLQEMQIYRPELMSESLSTHDTANILSKTNQEAKPLQYRRIEALYWDHCAALKIQQERPPLALRHPNIWCRPDAGEWASLVVRGTNQLHFLFEEKLGKAGKEIMQKRQNVLAALRQLNKIPLYSVPSRTSFTELIAAAQQVRGDVVQLEILNCTKRLQRYDSWYTMSLIVQRWFRGVLGRQRARATRKAIRFAYKLRVLYARQVATVATTFYQTEIRAVAVRRAYKVICTPVYTRVVMMDEESVIVSFQSLRHYQHYYHKDCPGISTTKHSIVPSVCCPSCAKLHHVKANYQSDGSKFTVFRGVCTCSLNDGSTHDGDSSSESWLIRAYNSSHNVIYRLHLDAPHLQQLLNSQKYSQLSPTPNYHSLIMDMETSRLEVTKATRFAMFCVNNAENAAEYQAKWRRMNSETTQIRKSLMVALENSLSLLESTKNAHVVSVNNAKKALDFQSRPFSKAQAWDPLENANDWRFIVEKRQLTKRLEEAHQNVERLRVEYFQATYNEQYARAGASKAQDDHNRIWLPLIVRGNRAMEEAALLETSAKTRMERFMEQLCDRFLTLRDGYLLPTRRNLVIQSPLWHDMIPFRIDIPGLCRRQNFVRRRTIVLSNLSEQKPRTRRMIVTVSMLPLISRGTLMKRDMLVMAYDPINCSVHKVFLEWELVQLLTGSRGKKIWQDSTQSKRLVWWSIADILLSLTMLDRFTGEFTLKKLQFYHTLRRLSPQYHSSQLMRDLQAGRKCGQGDEVLRQAMSVDGRLCVVVVYENWGDLTFSIYHSASGDYFRLLVPLCKVFDLLGTKPLMLRLWIMCVKSNSYVTTLLVYLMKHVRFYECGDSTEDVRIENKISTKRRSKRYQTVIRIQKRQVLVSIREDSAGDFKVSGYDVNSDFTYKLLLEREDLHRMLKGGNLPGDPAFNSHTNLATSSSSLLLRRNRKLLFEWICNHLHFQSLLGHPEMITSGTSPLFTGLHLRESFRLLNRWITCSPRNPVKIVSESEITHRASTIDADTFSNLQFDQLSLIAHDTLFDLEKEYVGTVDWIEAVVGQPTHTHPRKEQLPYMRMDFFVKAHALFGRLRGELEAEVIERKKRETWAGMEQEDYNSLCGDIAGSMNLAKEYILETWKKLTDLHTAAIKKMDQWQQIHSELRIITKSGEVIKEPKPTILAAQNAASMLHEDRNGVILDVINAGIPTASTDLPTFISFVVAVNSWRPLLSAATLLRTCLHRFELDFKLTFRNLELAFETIERSDDSLEKLRMHKRNVMRFCNFLARQITTYTIEDGEEANTGEIAKSPVKPVVSVSTASVNTGILIPSNTHESVQEVFLANMPVGDPSPTFSVLYAHATVEHVRSFFQQLWIQQHVSGSRFENRTPNGSGALTFQRVPYGILVYQASGQCADTRKQLEHLNPRAGALLRGKPIYGPALFWPLYANSHWYQRLFDSTAACMELDTIRDDLEHRDVYLRRSVAVRSSKYLPWKQFAIERLRVSQAVKRNQMTEGLCIDSLNSDIVEAEKQNRTITTISIGFRQLQISFGMKSSNEFRNNSAYKCLKHLFALHQNYSDVDYDSKAPQWRLSLNNPRILRNALDIYNAEGHAIQITRIDCEDMAMLKMEGIQVEIDDVNKPRRLIFSCREQQSQRKYFVDVDHHSLQHLLLQSEKRKTSTEAGLSALFDEGSWRHQAILMSVHKWRKFAALVSQFLVLRKKNGIVSLCLEVITPVTERQGDEEKLLSEKMDSNTTCCDSVVETPPVRLLESNEKTQKTEKHIEVQSSTLPVPCRSRASLLEEHNALKHSMMYHFMKHQPAIRAASVGRIITRTSTPLNICERSASEWMQMTREDWRSQELRGMLLLDVTVLAKLEKVYPSATKSAREYLKSSRKEDDTGGLKLQMTEIVKAMGQSAIESNELEILQSIRMKRWQRRGKEATVLAKRAEAYLADVAEWWRWRLTTMSLQKLKNRDKAAS